MASAAESMRISRQTAHKWWRRYQEAGAAGLEDRSSRPRRCPTKTPDRGGAPDRRVASAPSARAGPLGPEGRHACFDACTGSSHRHGVKPALRPRSRKGGRVIRRIETTQPGELVHIDVKKQAKIPKGGGWRVNGDARTDPRTARLVGPASATPTSIRPSMPIAAWPTPRSIPTNGPPRPSPSGVEPGSSSPATASPSSGCSRTTAAATGPRSSPPSSSLPALSTPVHQALPPSDQRQRSSASTGPCSERMGLCPPLSLRSSQNPGAGQLAPHVQPSSAPHGHRGPTRQSCQQPGWAEQLGA